VGEKCHNKYGTTGRQGWKGGPDFLVKKSSPGIEGADRRNAGGARKGTQKKPRKYAPSRRPTPLPPSTEEQEAKCTETTQKREGERTDFATNGSHTKRQKLNGKVFHQEGVQRGLTRGKKTR